MDPHQESSEGPVPQPEDSAAPMAAPPVAADTPPPQEPAPRADLPPLDKLVVAIHGIGSQLRGDTIRSVARRFGDRSSPPLPVMPLGYFQLDDSAAVRWSCLEAGPEDPLANIGFAEVYWADIPGQVVKANDTLEETKAWARTVVSRAESQYRRDVDGVVTPADFALGAGVVDEIAETVGVLENLLAVFEKMGLFKFDLAPLLRDYVGDVQLVTDFPAYRRKILFRFHNALSLIIRKFEADYRRLPEVYIVAHSEGTVISFLALLQALSGKSVTDPDAPQGTQPVPVTGDWVGCVRGYMTIGSPIDKHLLLWPALWEKLELRSRLDAHGKVIFDDPDTGQPRLTLAGQIKWRNYYDYGDPVGFQLDTAAGFLQRRGCAAFEFGPEHDVGFARYWLPGKAHIDYWDDREVFGHFIEDVVTAGGAARPPQSRPWVGPISTLLPYLFSLGLHAAGVYLLYKAMVDTGDKSPHHLPVPVALLSLLLFCITLAARLPRLVNVSPAVRGRWAMGSALSLVAAGACTWLLPQQVVEFLAGWALDWLAPAQAAHHDIAARAVLFLMACVVASSGWLAPRTPAAGRRRLLLAGTVLIGLILVLRLADTPAVDDSPQPVWPLALAGASFLYLWWLGIQVFDLAFVWHRYIRHSVAIDTLRAWRRRTDARATPLKELLKPGRPAGASSGHR